ncbi:MAG TPA: xanthine dehydrogenase family protein molybdopterin-binding subunit, partial [Chromatiales bacterium]|nr:xanthine dehydrogenase family protein molybdopterin-binding subunit [Chromatiales bacterium]
EGREMAQHCTAWVGVLSHLAGLKSAPQYALALDRVRWQGEPVAAVVALTRAQAEDALALIAVQYRELEPVVDMETALDPATPVIHPKLGDNLAFERRIEAGDVDAAFAEADVVVEETLHYPRHTGVTLEPRAILADYNAGDRKLTVHMSSQAPHMMKNIFATHLGIDEDDVRVVCKDVGGSFGIKIHTYPDEMATAALSVMLKRPVKFVADRLESFTSDIHARDHRVTAKMAVKDGRITAIEMDDLTGIGPYSVYPRTSAVECNQVLNLVGGPYEIANYRAVGRVVFLNKNVMCQYRAVGHPIAFSVTEALVDSAARKVGMDPAELRRNSVFRDDAYPCTAASGLKFESLSHQKSLEKLLATMDYDGLRREQAVLRRKGIYRGIGLAMMIEVTNPSPMFYGIGGAHISARDGVTIRLDPTGGVTAATGVTEQGQGTETMIAQIVASAVGVAMDRVRVVTGDTDTTPYGGGTWASRGAGIAGEAALQSGRALRANILDVAAALLQSDAAKLDIREGRVVDTDSGAERISLSDLAKTVYYRGNELPDGVSPELVATRHYSARQYPFAFTNGVQACWLEVDTQTGFVKLLKYWVVEDCGTVINPQLVDDQIRGGVVQGIGPALYEECLYDEQGQMLNATMADYLVPMSGAMPDIEVAHVETPTAESALGAKGA